MRGMRHAPQNRRIAHPIVCVLAAIVLIALSCRVIGSPDPEPGPLPGVDANEAPRPGPALGDASALPDAMPQLDAPDDAPEAQLDAPTS